MSTLAKSPGVTLYGPAFKAAFYAVFVAVFLIVFYPIIIIVFTAFKTNEEFINGSSLTIPRNFVFTNFVEALGRGRLLNALKNTLVLIVSSVTVNIFLGSMISYALNRFQFKLKPAIFGLFILSMVIPVVLTEIARFQIIRAFGIYNTIYAPMLLYLGTDLMQIAIFTQFVEKIPLSLDESAKIDGAGHWRIYFRIVLPLLLPGAATVAIIKTVEIINDMYTPFLYMPSADLKTLSTALMSFVGERFSDYPVMAAGIIWIMLPAVILYLFSQRLIFAGIAAGAVKE